MSDLEEAFNRGMQEGKAFIDKTKDTAVFDDVFVIADKICAVLLKNLSPANFVLRRRSAADQFNSGDTNVVLTISTKGGSTKGVSYRPEDDILEFEINSYNPARFRIGYSPCGANHPQQDLLSSLTDERGFRMSSRDKSYYKEYASTEMENALSDMGAIIGASCTTVPVKRIKLKSKLGLR